MGNKLFGINISGLVAKHIGPGVLPVTLRKVKAGTRTTGSLTGGTNPTTTVHTGRGFVESYRDSQVDGERIRRGDRRVTIIGDTLNPAAAPEAGDLIDIDGERLAIVPDGVSADPAKATYTCQARAY